MSYRSHNGVACAARSRSIQDSVKGDDLDVDLEFGSPNVKCAFIVRPEASDMESLMIV